MILSYDTIKMSKPPLEITPEILKSVASISEKMGEVNTRYLIRQDPKLRKQNQIKTIHASLQIEGNTLSEAQITAILENKRVVGPEKDIREVLNALEVYKNLKLYNYQSEKHFLNAYRQLMLGLIPSPGKYRTKGVGIVEGSMVKHLAPPCELVKPQMTDLFRYLKGKTELTLIKSCVFHYELEFIHPFMDGNGRMGRLWQTLILMSEYPLFEFLPFETLIAKNQKEYYQALSLSDKEGKSTRFIEFMLGILDQSLAELLQRRSQRPNETQRLQLFLEDCDQTFSRKEYMKRYPEISTATASRDLKNGVENGLIEKFGDKSLTLYRRHNIID